MINLIPPASKKQIVRDYWLRVTTVWLFLVTIALVVVACLLVPTYILIASQRDALTLPVPGETEAVTSEDATDIVQSTMALVDHMSALQGTSTFSVYLRELEIIAGPAVTIKQLTLRTDESDDSARLSLSGVADTRSSLAAFRDGVNEHPLFSDAELPIGSLTQDREITFPMTITIP